MRTIGFYIFLVLIFVISCSFIGFKAGEKTVQAYIEGYRVGWAHGAENRPAQLGCGSDLKFIGVGKECLYDDYFDVKRQLKIFKDGRCPK